VPKESAKAIKTIEFTAVNVKYGLTWTAIEIEIEYIAFVVAIHCGLDPVPKKVGIGSSFNPIKRRRQLLVFLTLALAIAAFLALKSGLVSYLECGCISLSRCCFEDRFFF
jgi:hypothetical protein